MTQQPAAHAGARRAQRRRGGDALDGPGRVRRERGGGHLPARGARRPPQPAALPAGDPAPLRGLRPRRAGGDAAGRQRGPRGHGILGLVADVVRTSPRFERAIEAALGARLQHVLVESQRGGSRAGRATWRGLAEGRSSFCPALGPAARPTAHAALPSGVHGGWWPEPLEEVSRPRTRSGQWWKRCFWGRAVGGGPATAACAGRDRRARGLDRGHPGRRGAGRATAR